MSRLLNQREHIVGVEMSQDVALPPLFWNVDPTSSQVTYNPKVNLADTVPLSLQLT